MHLVSKVIISLKTQILPSLKSPGKEALSHVSSWDAHLHLLKTSQWLSHFVGIKTPMKPGFSITFLMSSAPHHQQTILNLCFSIIHGCQLQLTHALIQPHYLLPNPVPIQPHLLPTSSHTDLHMCMLTGVTSLDLIQGFYLPAKLSSNISARRVPSLH